jgi:hypothetical protein
VKHGDRRRDEAPPWPIRRGETDPGEKPPPGNAAGAAERLGEGEDSGGTHGAPGAPRERAMASAPGDGLPVPMLPPKVTMR